MAINLDERYPGRANGKTLSYPQGSFKNRTSPTSKDGTYLEQDWANDQLAFFQSLIKDAGMTANGTVDTVRASQYFDALIRIINNQAKRMRMRVRLTAATDANTLIEDNVFYAWSNSVAMGANFPNIKGPGYLHSTIMASDYVTQDLVLIASALKPYCFNRAGNPVTGVWHPWKVTSSFSNTNVIPNWDAGDIYMDGVGWHRWNGARYVADYSLRRFPASALPATDVGPVLVAEFGEIWHWVSTPGYAGYRSPTCGQVAYFLTDREPAGWLKANGTEASRKVFAGIFSIIGTRHGTGDGVTNFRLPDLRGEFIRSLDDSRGIDPGRSMGSNQADAFQGHGHRFMRGSGGIGSGMYGAGFFSSAPDDTKVLEATGIGVNGAPRTANETRPRNIALMAYIKI